MINIDKDYLIAVDLKNTKVKSDKTIFFYNTDLNICNIFIKLICSDEDKTIPEDLIVEFAVLKPETDEFKPLDATLISKEDLLYQVDLTTDYFDIIGTYECEIRVSGTIENELKCFTSEEFNYVVKPNITAKLNKKISENKNLPILEKLIKDVKEITDGINKNEIQMKRDENLVGDNKSVVGAINQLREDVNSGTGGGTAELKDYQKKNDEFLNTTSKEIVGAINEVNTQCKDIANLSLTKHTDGKVYIKKQDGTLVGDGIEIGGSDVDLSKISMSMDGQTLKLLNDGTQITTVEIPTAVVTDEQLTTIIQAKIDDGTLSALSIEDGSIGINKTTLVDKIYKNVYDLEKLKTDSNYLAIRNVKANTKYYIRATWSKTLYAPNTIYSLNESNNSKNSIGTLTTETIDSVDYYTFTVTSDYDLIGLFRADGNPSPHEQYCTLGVYGFETPFQLETVDNGLNENWKNPLIKYLSPVIETNTLNKFDKNDNSTNKLISPNKTDFMEMTTSKSVGCYNYADVLFDTILGNYTYNIPDTSKSEKELQYRWYKASYNTWATKLGVTGNGYGIFLLPLTPGTWYIRRLLRNRYSPDINIVGFANPDIATNPTTILSDSGIEITNYQKFTYTDDEGIQHNEDFIDFGEWNYITGSGSHGESTVCLHKVVIPNGVYGFLTGNLMADSYPTGHNELYTIMDYNPIDNILQKVEDSFQTETIKPTEKYKKVLLQT